jgi:single-strand DNA-binding protein
MNKVILDGRLTRDVETRKLPSGSTVANFSLATTRVYYTAEKEKKEETAFVDCELYGPRGDNLQKYTSKGRRILVEGRLKQDKWQDKEGGNRSKIVVVVEDFDFLDFPKESTPNETSKAEPPKRTATGRGSRNTQNTQGGEEPPF